MPEEEKNSEETTEQYTWDDIIEDAKVAKIAEVKWDGKVIKVPYKELIGPEDLEVDRKYGNDQEKLILTKAMMMVMKANTGDEKTDMTKERWSKIPARLRNLIVYKVLLEGLGALNRDFQNMPAAQEDSA